MPGLHEIVSGAGILFPLGDERKLAEEIMKLDNDPDYYKKVAANGLLRARQFDITTMVEKHIELYNSL